MEVVVFYRGYWSYLVSLYHELLKHGLDISFEEFRGEVAKEGSFRMRGEWLYSFDFRAIAAEFSHTFGASHVHCEPYTYTNANIIPRFWSLLGQISEKVPVDLTGLIELDTWLNKSST